MTDVTIRIDPATKPAKKSARQRKAELRQTWRVWRGTGKPLRAALDRNGQRVYVVDNGEARAAGRAAMLARRAARLEVAAPRSGNAGSVIPMSDIVGGNADSIVPVKVTL